MVDQAQISKTVPVRVFKPDMTVTSSWKRSLVFTDIVAVARLFENIRMEEAPDEFWLRCIFTWGAVSEAASRNRALYLRSTAAVRPPTR